MNTTPSDSVAICLDHQRLSQAVVEAVQQVYMAKADLEKAKTGTLSILAPTSAFSAARSAERIAVGNLAWHRRAHGC